MVPSAPLANVTTELDSSRDVTILSADVLSVTAGAAVVAAFLVIVATVCLVVGTVIILIICCFTLVLGAAVLVAVGVAVCRDCTVVVLLILFPVIRVQIVRDWIRCFYTYGFSLLKTVEMHCWNLVIKVLGNSRLEKEQYCQYYLSVLVME